MLACALWGRISDPVFFGVFRCAVPKYNFASMHRFQRWRDLFQGASTVQGVERLIRDYVDSIPPTVLAAAGRMPACAGRSERPTRRRHDPALRARLQGRTGNRRTASRSRPHVCRRIPANYAAHQGADDRRLISNYPVNDPGRFLQRFKTKRPYSGRLFSMYMFISPIEGLPSGPSQRP